MIVFAATAECGCGVCKDSQIPQEAFSTLCAFCLQGIHKEWNDVGKDANELRATA